MSSMLPTSNIVAPMKAVTPNKPNEISKAILGMGQVEKQVWCGVMTPLANPISRV